ELANYLIWKIIERFKNDFIDWSWEPRRQECFDFTYSNFQIILDSIYIRKHFPEDSRKAAIELTTYVENEYLNFLEKIDWMDEESKAYSMKKANARKLHYGYEKEILNDSFLSHFYTNLTFKDEDFICNILKLKKWLLNKPFSQRKSKPEHLKIKSSPFFKMIDSRASFDPTTNKIEITAAFFQNPLFNKDQPNYLNFGALGFIYGHEIIHGFNGESSGEMLDNFWSNETNYQFKIKTKCFLDQYAKYTIRNGMKVDSNKTQNDNIADNIGYELAYLAYQSWLRDNGREPVLLGLKYTQNQLFWISAASNLCMKFSTVAEAQRLEMDYHSPAQFRVIGAISNVPEFARDFNCPPDSPMNPKNKCRVWRDN
ncbi:neprilysin-2-like, partial [Stegodyphus dumicola]|uniref:neprilysin-2-like n=1 Tax=Stegodyphus dumicola TaxID=202533 RepID=UPI0015AD274A